MLDRVEQELSGLREQLGAVHDLQMQSMTALRISEPPMAGKENVTTAGSRLHDITLMIRELARMQEQLIGNERMIRDALTVDPEAPVGIGAQQL